MKGTNYMKRYKLLKDLPFAKAGEELYLKFSEDSEFFLVYKGTDKAYAAELNPEFIDNFDEWFEEVKEPELPKEFFYVLINKIASVNYLTFSFDEETKQEYRNIVEKNKSVDNYFETKEEAEKYLEYLKAKAIIKRDAKGFKPNWNNNDEEKYLGFWDLEEDKLDWLPRIIFIEATIYFKSREDIEESFKKHPDEWKTYLTYEG